jgi:hypothetical protein
MTKDSNWRCVAGCAVVEKVADADRGRVGRMVSAARETGDDVGGTTELEVAEDGEIEKAVSVVAEKRGGARILQFRRGSLLEIRR